MHFQNRERPLVHSIIPMASLLENMISSDVKVFMRGGVLWGGMGWGGVGWGGVGLGGVGWGGVPDRWLDLTG